MLAAGAVACSIATHLYCAQACIANNSIGVIYALHLIDWNEQFAHAREKTFSREFRGMCHGHGRRVSRVDRRINSE
jgi:hypothetical protein